MKRPGKRLTSQILILAGTTEVQYAQNGNTSPLEFPRSPLNTGSSDVATAGPGSPLVSHPLEYEKTVVFVRHGMTTWNEQKRIQVSLTCFFPHLLPSSQVAAGNAGNFMPVHFTMECSTVVKLCSTNTQTVTVALFPFNTAEAPCRVTPIFRSSPLLGRSRRR